MPEESKDLWTQILELLSQVVTPDWNAVILLLPFAFLGLALLILLLMSVRWRRSTALNRPRLAPRRAPSPPPGVHLPGPSPWPFIAPIGGAIILLSLVFPGGGLPVNPILFAIGLAVSGIAVVGWLWDAGREWRRVEAGPGHGGALYPGLALEPGSATAQLGGGRAMEIPPGIHVPGPSPWPFFVPIGGSFVLLGLIFGPILILAGIIMCILAVIGWYRDAGHEYDQVEAGHLPEPTTRDPERAFPKRLLRVYGAIAVVALALTIAPSIIGGLPGNAGGGASGTPAESPDPAPELAADSALAFSTGRLVVPADAPIDLTFDNRQAGVPHNVHVLQGSEPVFEGETVTGPTSVVYHVPPLQPGEYQFICSIHPPMTGTLVAR